MSLREIAKIDIVTSAPDGTPELMLLDLGDVESEIERHGLLLEKIGTCVAFVASGQYREHFPDAQPWELRIRVVCRTPPNSSMTAIHSALLPAPQGARLPVVFELEKDLRPRIEAEMRARNAAKKPWWRLR